MSSKLHFLYINCIPCRDLRHYNTRLSSGDAPVADRVKSLEKDPELSAVFEDIKKNGMEAAMKYYQAPLALYIN